MASESPKTRDVKNHLLFEISTEVANRGGLFFLPFSAPEHCLIAWHPTVGGIYSVIKSKAPVTTAEYGERYCLIGPLNRQSVRSQPAPLANFLPFPASLFSSSLFLLVSIRFYLR